MAEIINKEVIKKIAKITGEDVQRQYPKEDYLACTVMMAVLSAASKVLDLDIRP